MSSLRRDLQEMAVIESLPLRQLERIRGADQLCQSHPVPRMWAASARADEGGVGLRDLHSLRYLSNLQWTYFCNDSGSGIPLGHRNAC